MGILEWFRKRRERHALKRGVDLLYTQYSIQRTGFMTRLSHYAKQHGLHGVNLELVGCIMMAEPADPAVRAMISPDDLAAAERIAQAALEDCDLRHHAAEASHGLALLFQMQASNAQSPFEPDMDRLLRSLICVENAIRHGNRLAPYRMTAARILGMMQEHEKAYEHAQLAVEANVANVEAIQLAGDCAFAMERFEEAEAYFSWAKELAPRAHADFKGYA